MEKITITPTKWAVVVGYVEYHAGRQFPWMGRHGCTLSFFATEAEATQFAITGEL